MVEIIRKLGCSIFSENVDIGNVSIIELFYGIGISMDLSFTI